MKNFIRSFFTIRSPISIWRRLIWLAVGLSLVVWGYRTIGKKLNPKYSPTPGEIYKAVVEMKDTQITIFEDPEEMFAGIRQLQYLFNDSFTFKPHVITPGSILEYEGEIFAGMRRVQHIVYEIYGTMDKGGLEGEKVSMLWADFKASMKRISYGFCIGAIFAIIMGTLLSTFKDIEGVFGSILTFFAAIPAIAFMAYFMVIFDDDFKFQVGIIGYAVFLDLTGKVRDTSDKVPKQSIDTLMTLGASRFEIYIHIVRQALPAIIRNVRATLALAWIYLIASESVGAEQGLGLRILKVKRYTQIDRMFGIIIIIGLTAIVIDLLFNILNLLLFPWEDVNREQIKQYKSSGIYRFYRNSLRRIRSHA